jgi:hypothetical protein
MRLEQTKGGRYVCDPAIVYKAVMSLGFDHLAAGHEHAPVSPTAMMERR